MKQPHRKSWRWKVADRAAGEQPGLLYEPGNWGDILKDLWVVKVTRCLLESSRKRPLKVLDPFAGRPRYPLTEASAERFEKVGDPDLKKALKPFLSRCHVPSTALLAQACAQVVGSQAELGVFDVEPGLRKLWSEVPRARVLDISSGYEALSMHEASEADLILLDPYDLFDAWKEALRPAISLSPERAVLLYLYNKAPRGEGFARNYRSFRQELQDGLEPVRGRSTAALGRVPSDAILPRAHHEVVLLGPAGFVEKLRPELRAATEELAGTISRLGAWEDPLEGPHPG